MDPSPTSDEYYNDPLSGHVLHGRSGPLATSTNTTSAATPNTAANPSASNDQRWSTFNHHNRSGNLEHKQHGPMFEHEPECTTFNGLPPLSQAFHPYPQYPRMTATNTAGATNTANAGNANYLDTPYSHNPTNTIHLGQAHAVTMTTPRTTPTPYTTAYGNSTNDIHGYFGSNRANDELFSSNSHYMNHPPPGPPGTALGSTPINTTLNPASGTTLGSVPSTTTAYPPSNLDSRLPMNGQPHRLSPAYSSNLIHPSMGPLTTDSPSPQHFWPGYAMHGHALADRTSNNGFRPPSPINVPRQSVAVPTGMHLPYKAPNKVKQIYSFVPLPGAQTQKRPRRRYDEIERIYQCGWNGCEKAYGTLNHLNAHVFMQGHGEKRTPDEFKEIRAVWRAKKKEEVKKRQAEDQLRQEEQKRHALPTPQASRQLSSIPESQSHPPNLSHVVYAHLPQPLPNVYPYPPSQASLSESSHQHTYSNPAYHTSLLPHLNQYTAQPQPYASSNRDYKSHADEEDRDAEGEPDSETPR